MTITQCINSDGTYLWGELRELRIQKQLKHHSGATWPSEPKLSKEIVDYITNSIEFTGVVYYIVERDEAVARVWLDNGSAYIDTSGKTPEAAKAILEWLREMQPESEPEEDKVRVTFWSYSPTGPQSITRYLDAATWEQVEGNYDGDTYEGLTEMMSDDFRPARGGQLLLWAGDAGTGKTHALRALAREWKDWCTIQYIVDPEVFFGSHASYLTSVLLGTDEIIKQGEKPKWRLLVLEDSGELMRADAADTTGKALSRLLNTVDGLIGQGLRIMVLVTTNEEVGKLHPAIARPGRCAVEIKFEQLSEETAREWRENHDLPTNDVPHTPTLAELYAELEGFKGAKSKQAVGFAFSS